MEGRVCVLMAVRAARPPSLLPATPRCLYPRSKVRIEREDAKAALDQANVDKRMLQLELAR